jgi:streptomycin 6-kinase
VTTLAAAVQTQLQRWRLRRDGHPLEAPGVVVVPVRTPDGEPAVLKITSPERAGADETDYAHLALRRWAGDGAVRLLSADPPHRAVLLERLHSASLASVPDVQACEVIAGLYRRLHVVALPQLSTVTSHLNEWTEDLRELPRSAPIPRRLVEQALALSRGLADDPGARLLHGNLHYDNVLAGNRAPWLAIAPRPVNGDPHYELAPVLWSRWDEMGGDIRAAVQRRFYAMVGAAGFDEERARAWTLVRVVRAAIRDPSQLTKYVALAKAVQD